MSHAEKKFELSSFGSFGDMAGGICSLEKVHQGELQGKIQKSGSVTA